ncbi:SDR family NAD(P)-dependent oxidoreductase [Oscillochloris sp. ZM17-4]|uniref:SDR family oxidoreductase n=1 Tax=Oscillochloris sp. ZM17-4 TaxID=2866714 RepID=UPI001C734B45|nr:SDR family NAD(P)-dependent oxidoreductase [Oscillochloris sp. ZM17-4]MBX0328911.1 SDR family NAD(P)-dependent oxidoreductase [Oscillochloris sp. ZM17-4]
MPRVAVVTGAGSGVGRVVALMLARESWAVALVGRREETLRETIRLAGAGGAALLALPCDIGDPAEVAAMAERAAQLGDVEVLVNSAGTNTAARSLAELSTADYHRIVDTNMHGAYYCSQAFLPGMRERGAGTIINIASIAGLRASAVAGAAYAMSKFGMAGLTQAINAEERRHGVRACAIFPGEINTPLLDQRPSPPPPEIRERMLQPEDVARCALLAINLPPRAIIEEMVLVPETQES